MESKNAKLGLQLFCVYSALYTGFVLLNTFSPATMEHTPVAGINIAILYGFALIIGAFVLALVYGALCSADPGPSNADDHAAQPRETQPRESEQA